MWDGRFSISINYQSDRVLFKIEDDYYKYINNNIFNDHLSESHFKYFSDTIHFLQNNLDEISRVCAGFRQQLPIEYIRDQKLKEIIYDRY